MKPGMTRRTSLFRFRTPSPDSLEIEIRRPETDAQNAAEIARQRESWVAKTRCEPAKWRQLRLNFLGGDMANRDVTVWLGWEDSNSHMSFFEKYGSKLATNSPCIRGNWG
jgi:hypothetical protein